MSKPFILYSQDLRPIVREEYPELSNTEISRFLNKMWKEESSEVKLQYEQRAAELVEQYQRDHPDTGSTEKNPIIKDLHDQVEAMKNK